MNTKLPILRSVADLTTASLQTNKNMGNQMTAIYIVSVDRLRLEDFFCIYQLVLYFRLWFGENHVLRLVLDFQLISDLTFTI